MASFILQVIIKGHLPAPPATEIWPGDPAKTGAEGPRMELQVPVYSIEDIAETGEDIGAIFKEAVGGTEKKKSSD